MKLNMQERDALLAGLHMLKTLMQDSLGQLRSTAGQGAEANQVADLLTNGGTHEGVDLEGVSALADKLVQAYPSPTLAPKPASVESPKLEPFVSPGDIDLNAQWYRDDCGTHYPNLNSLKTYMPEGRRFVATVDPWDTMQTVRSLTDVVKQYAEANQETHVGFCGSTLERASKWISTGISPVEEGVLLGDLIVYADAYVNQQASSDVGAARLSIAKARALIDAMAKARQHVPVVRISPSVAAVGAGVTDSSTLNPAWLPEQQAKARAKGWDIVEMHESAFGQWQLQRAGDSLASDNAAWKLVLHSCESHHVAALQFLRAHNINEFMNIRTLAHSSECFGGIALACAIDDQFKQHHAGERLPQLYEAGDDANGRWAKVLADGKYFSVLVYDADGDIQYTNSIAFATMSGAVEHADAAVQNRNVEVCRG